MNWPTVAHNVSLMAFALAACRLLDSAWPCLVLVLVLVPKGSFSPDEPKAAEAKEP